VAIADLHVNFFVSLVMVYSGVKLTNINNNENNIFPVISEKNIENKY
jgi:hypothetical protein